MGLALLAIAIFVFAAWHVIPALPQIKAPLAGVLGRSFGPAYGILSLLLLIFVLWSFHKAEPNILYDPPTWGRHANYLLSLIGFIFVGVFLFRGSWRNQLRFPMAIGVTLWALGHLIANGDGRTTLLFCGLAAAAWAHAALRARLPRSPTVERQGHNGLSILAGFALFGLATQLHTVFAGVPLIVLQK
jgi:uncharacterized membrane protein